ncbi:MAG: CoA-acylating methylmalonate-semialdehyde dehydrogenase [Chloroflexi bacterium]|nr:CoA-acylating methylmalonate-semialdehyde dehydrogenase [Chloroflexota bacterium]
MTRQLENFIDGQWMRSQASEYLDIMNPATLETLAQVPLSPGADVMIAANAASQASVEWRRTPAGERIQYLFKLKNLLEQHLDELARAITIECGKTLAESIGELQRGIENVQVACGIPSLMQGNVSEDIARGIDETMIRQPLGVVAAITPFNFPAMIPLWFLPYAVATGNCFILKPSERVPLTACKLFELIQAAGFPPGVVQLIHGGKATVDAILDHPVIRAVSFVGSTQVARYIYSRAAAQGKRAQCQGGAKNPVVIMPDADMTSATRVLADSAFGCAGQRCLAAADAIAVGDAHRAFTEQIVEVAMNRRVGYGLEKDVEMGPVISAASQSRIANLIEQGKAEGGKILVDGRERQVRGYEQGYFIFPTIIDALPAESQLAKTEIFGPVLSTTQVNTLDEAIGLVNLRRYGNSACIFTSSGAAARQFRYEVNAGNVGVNIAIAAPMAYYPFSGWGDSFFGDLHGQARHGVEFYTQTKVVVERWSQEWTRKF